MTIHVFLSFLSTANEKNLLLIQVGKWNGQPIYKTLDKDTFIGPQLSEYYCHAPYWDFLKKAHEEQIQV